MLYTFGHFSPLLAAARDLRSRDCISIAERPNRDKGCRTPACHRRDDILATQYEPRATRVPSNNPNNYVAHSHTSLGMGQDTPGSKLDRADCPTTNNNEEA